MLHRCSVKFNPEARTSTTTRPHPALSVRSGDRSCSQSRFGSTKSGKTSAGRDRSIAVLPFESLSANPEDAYFAVGLQDEILTSLARLGRPEGHLAHFDREIQEQAGKLKTIGQELGVNTVLEGSVQREGDTVRVNVQLIDARTDTHRWAERLRSRNEQVCSRSKAKSHRRLRAPCRQNFHQPKQMA